MTLANERLRNLGFLMHDVSGLYGRYFERHVRELQLTLVQCIVLAQLSPNEGINQARLAVLTGTDPMTLVRTLDRMQQDEWIERRPDPADRRANCLYLREGIKPIVARMWNLADQVRSEVLSVLRPQEREQLVGLLERLHGHLHELNATAFDSEREQQALEPGAQPK